MPPAMSERRTSLIGAMLVAIGPISMAIYTPAMPTLVEAFETDESLIKLSLSLFFGGFAFSQLVCGPLSDAFGRRPVTVLFLVIYILGSLMALLATDIGWLLVARVVQGMGASVGVATARAIVRDQYTGEISSRILSTIGIMLALGPALAPSIGGITLAIAGWHAIFVVMFLIGLALIIVVLLSMRETAQADPSLIRPAQIMRSYRALAVNPLFLSASLTVGASVGALYTLASVLPFVLIDGAGLTPMQFGLGMLAQSGMFFLGSIAMRTAMVRVAAGRLVPVGLGFIGAGALALAASILFLPVSYLSIMGPVGLYAFGIAFVMPAMTTASLAPFPHNAGSAAAAMGFIQMGAGLVGGVVCAWIGEPVLATWIVIPAMGAMSIGAYALYRSAARRMPPSRPIAR